MHACSVEGVLKLSSPGLSSSLSSDRSDIGKQQSPLNLMGSLHVCFSLTVSLAAACLDHADPRRCWWFLLAPHGHVASGCLLSPLCPHGSDPRDGLEPISLTPHSLLTPLSSARLAHCSVSLTPALQRCGRLSGPGPGLVSSVRQPRDPARHRHLCPHGRLRHLPPQPDPSLGLAEAGPQLGVLTVACKCHAADGRCLAAAGRPVCWPAGVWTAAWSVRQEHCMAISYAGMQLEWTFGLFHKLFIYWP